MATTVIVSGIKPELKILGDEQTFIFNDDQVSSSASLILFNKFINTITNFSKTNLIFSNPNLKGFIFEQRSYANAIYGDFALSIFDAQNNNIDLFKYTETTNNINFLKSISLNSNLITNLANGIDNNDAINLGQLNSAINNLGFGNLTQNGLMVRTATNTYASRTLTIGDNNLSVQNGNGILGNPTLFLQPTLTDVIQISSGSLNANLNLCTNLANFNVNLFSSTSLSSPVKLTFFHSNLGEFNNFFFESQTGTIYLNRGIFSLKVLNYNNTVQTIFSYSGQTNLFSFSKSIDMLGNSLTNFSPININTLTTGSLSISRLANYPSSSTLYLRGDGTWVAPINNNLDSVITLGFIALTSSGATNILASRTLTAGTGISITNGNGVSGNPTIGISTIPINSLAGYPSASGLFLNGFSGWTNPCQIQSSAIDGSRNFFIDNLSSSSPNNEFMVKYVGNPMIGCGFNTSTYEGYLWVYSNAPLKIGTNNIKRMQFRADGTADFIGFNVVTTGNGSFGTGNIPTLNTSLITNATNIFSNKLYVNEIYANGYTLIQLGALQISNYASVGLGTYGYLNSSGQIGTSSGTNNYSIYASYRIAASEFNAISSIKKKNILARGHSVETEVIDLIKNTEFFKYSFKDTIAEKGVRYGIIAEELGKTLPDYVDFENLEYIPNIMDTCIVSTLGANQYQLTFEKDFNISLGRLKLFDHNNTCYLVEVYDILDDKNIVVCSEKELPHDIKNIFVYGSLETCPSVASKVTELSLIGIKHLIKRIEGLEKFLSGFNNRISIK